MMKLLIGLLSLGIISSTSHANTECTYTISVFEHSQLSSKKIIEITNQVMSQKGFRNVPKSEAQFELNVSAQWYTKKLQFPPSEGFLGQGIVYASAELIELSTDNKKVPEKMALMYQHRDFYYLKYKKKQAIDLLEGSLLSLPNCQEIL